DQIKSAFAIVHILILNKYFVDRTPSIDLFGVRAFKIWGAEFFPNLVDSGLASYNPKILTWPPIGKIPSRTSLRPRRLSQCVLLRFSDVSYTGSQRERKQNRQQ